MNLNNNPTMDQLRDLLRPLDDRAAHHVLWVDHAGEVHVTPLAKEWRPIPEPGPDVLDNALVRFHTFYAGYGYVGPEAVTDDEWITEALEWMLRDWAKANARGEPILIRP
jgi:hypothetical protein